MGILLIVVGVSVALGIAMYAVGKYMDRQESVLDDIYRAQEVFRWERLPPGGPAPGGSSTTTDDDIFRVEIEKASKDFTLTVLAMQEQIDELWEEIREL